jgi:tetratricopeptide (TPR) repeat protein
MIADAIASLEQAVRLAPEQPLAHTNLAGAYFDAERFQDAKRELEAALKLLDLSGTRATLYVTAIYMGDQALADAQIEAVRGRRDEVDMLPSRTAVALMQGRNRDAATLSEDCFQKLKSSGSSRLEFSGELFISYAISHAMAGREDLARADVARVMDNKLDATGGSDELVALGAILGDRRLSDSWLDKAVEHMRRVSVTEDREKNERAMRVFAAVAAGRYQEAYDLASIVGTSDGSQRYVMYAAARAAMQLQRWPDAIRFLEALRSWNHKVGTSALPATLRIMLARAYAASGRQGDARKAYDEAFEIWKRADADLPLLVEAKKEYAALGS